MSIPYNLYYITDAQLDGIPKSYAYPSATSMVITCTVDLAAGPTVFEKTVTFNEDGSVSEEGQWAPAE